MKHFRGKMTTVCRQQNNHSMNRNHTGIISLAKDIALMLNVVVYACGVYLIFGVGWAVMLGALYWFIINPIILVVLAVAYFVLFAPNFYPVFSGEPLWRRSQQVDEHRRRI